MPACPACRASNAADSRFCSACGARLTADPAALTRKTVTTLHSDLAGFTTLSERMDPESMHTVMGRYFTAMHGAIERHGGQVEKYIGDAIMAIFGHPHLHEDDALRAARCAMEMRDELTLLNRELEAGWGVTLHARYGLATGEVAFARVGSQPFFALGDAVNLAQRLETAAPADEVLINRETARLLGSSARLQRLDPLNLKGKAEPVPAWRLVALLPAGEAAPLVPGPRMVGRDDELEILQVALADVQAERRCRLVTVLGAAGVGKSCLVRSFLSEAEESATTLFGRCLSYGEGITFWPLAAIVEQLAGRADETAIVTLLGDDEDGRWVAERVARAVGFAPGAAAIEEIQLAVRRLLEAAARRRPVVVVVEDIQWAEPTLLGVLEHVASYAHDVPLLLVCLARPELLKRRPAWPVAHTVRLGPLSEPASERLLEQLDPVVAVNADERARLLAAAEGNPFFLEQLVAMRQETGSIAAIPATIQAILAARADALGETERAVIDCAAIEGRQFHRGVVAELLAADYRPGVDQALASLVDRDLIRPGRPDLPGEEGYRFSHNLVRDSVYALLPKARRADMHERYARSLEARSVGDRDFREIIGYHFEQAHRCSTDLQPGKSPDHRRLAEAGAGHLGAVGRTALGRGDVPAAVNLLERATRLLDDDEPALGWLLPELGTALAQAGSLPEAENVLSAAVRRASEQGEPADEAHALVCLLSARLRLDTGAAAQEVHRRFPDLLATFSANDDDLGLDRLWRLRAQVHWIEGSGEADAAWEVGVEHAGRAGDEEGRADALCWLASSAFSGPMPAVDGIVRCEAMRVELHGNPLAQAFVLQPLAALWAMRGEWATARELLAESNAMVAELGNTLLTAAVRYYEAFVALLGDDPGGAEASLRDGYQWLQEKRETALRADLVVMLARAMYAQGRFDEAFDLTHAAEQGADPDDRSPQIDWRTVRGAILARRGHVTEAKRLTADALALVEHTDWLNDHADALMTRAELLVACGEHGDSAEAMQAALALYERKGNVTTAENVRAMLARAPVGVRGSAESRR
jgi:class 3 adenylate cyclase/tetratricopeptide (TPR) repeat protein